MSELGARCRCVFIFISALLFVAQIVGTLTTLVQTAPGLTHPYLVDIEDHPQWPFLQWRYPCSQ